MNHSRNERLATQASILLACTIADLDTTIHAKALIRAGLISKTKLHQLLVQLEQLDFSQKTRPAPEHYNG